MRKFRHIQFSMFLSVSNGVFSVLKYTKEIKIDDSFASLEVWDFAFLPLISTFFELLQTNTI